MAENPNVTPIFIKYGGLIGRPISLTNQVCTKANPGSTPVIIYDNSTSAGYSSGNGALIENVIVVATDTVVKSILYLFFKITSDESPVWRPFDEIDLPAIGTSSTSTKDTNYPLVSSLSRKIIAVPANVGTVAYPLATRLNGDSLSFQLGCALSIAIGTSPIYIWLSGGEY